MSPARLFVGRSVNSLFAIMFSPRFFVCIPVDSSTLWILVFVSCISEFEIQSAFLILKVTYPQCSIHLADISPPWWKVLSASSVMLLYCR